MKYYNLLKLNSILKNHRLKFLGLWGLHVLKKRYLAVNFDPVLSCNLRCRMCYFTDKEYNKTMKGYFPVNDLDLFAKAILPRAVKLQIGCGAEPTLYKDLNAIIKLGKKYKVPYISLTTNANLVKKDDLVKWISNGLDEITISMHGVKKDTYTYFMQNSDYTHFKEILEDISEIKNKFNSFKLRINYTFNEDNFNELKYFFDEFKNVNLDILQIRPITKLGETEYNNFSFKNIIPYYEIVYKQLKKESAIRNIIFIAPTLKQMKTSDQSQDSIISEYIYCYVSPNYFFKEDFNWKNETYEEFSKRTKLARKIFKHIFSSKKQIENLKNKTLNYSIN
jgi:molybdenum cofactor biosynthesis enzyme MoaA